MEETRPQQAFANRKIMGVCMVIVSRKWNENPIGTYIKIEFAAFVRSETVAT
jgi:hypothetical protein